MKKSALIFLLLLILFPLVSAGENIAYSFQSSCTSDILNPEGNITCVRGSDGNFNTNHFFYGQGNGYQQYNFSLNLDSLEKFTNITLFYDHDDSDDGWLAQIYCQLDNGTLFILDNFNHAHFRQNFTQNIPLFCVNSNNVLSILFDESTFNGGLVLLYETWIDYTTTNKETDPIWTANSTLVRYKAEQIKTNAPAFTTT